MMAKIYIGIDKYPDNQLVGRPRDFVVNDVYWLNLH